MKDIITKHKTNHTSIVIVKNSCLLSAPDVANRFPGLLTKATIDAKHHNFMHFVCFPGALWALTWPGWLTGATPPKKTKNLICQNVNWQKFQVCY